MAILGTTVWRVLPGKMPEFFANLATAKKIGERLGARVRVLNQMVGSNAPCTVVVFESADWKAYGELQTKMATDTDWQAFFQKAVATNSNPAAELIGTGLSVEVSVG